MHFYYLDPGLRNDLGHHANSCRLITGELRDLGVGLSVFAHTAIEPALRAELRAAAHFRRHTYTAFDFDPVAGWLTSFTLAATDTAHDLARLPPPDPDDIVYLNSAQAPQLMAMLTWMRGLPHGRTPHVMIEFGTDPGVDLERAPGGVRVVVRDVRRDPRAVLYRHAASLLNDVDRSRLHLFTFDSRSSQLYGFVLKTGVGVLPLPHIARTEVRSRVGAKPVTVAVLGHQRPDKGYALVPDIVERLLEQRPDIRLLIHNGAPNEMAETQLKVRALLDGRPQITVDERLAGPEIWQGLLRQSDLILCPYPAWRFASAYSAVAAEAVACAIPLVVPAYTTLSELVERYGGGGTTFATHDAPAIVAAVIEALDRFDELAGIADRGALRWHATMGARSMVKALLSLPKREGPGRGRVEITTGGVSVP
jgi:glycosyltransferase involved in cell wall biosynthesis